MKLAIYPSRENGYVVAPMLPDNHEADKRAVARAQKKVMADAAPELLKALEWTLREFAHFAPKDLALNICRENAQAAVRKARGIEVSEGPEGYVA